MAYKVKYRRSGRCGSSTRLKSKAGASAVARAYKKMGAKDVKIEKV